MENKITKETREALAEVEKLEGEVEMTKPKKQAPATVQKREVDKKTMTEYRKRTQIIKKQIGNIENSFLTIAFQLHWIKRNNMYKANGSKNIYEFAENEYGLGKTTCCNLICIVDNFAERKDNGEIMEEIKPCYKNFKASQLVAMIGMSQDGIKQITENMSVRKINELRKAEQQKEALETEQKEEKPEKTEGKVVNTLISFDSYQSYQKELESMDMLIERAFKKSKAPVRIKIVCEQG